jgi:hypothetical protein
VSEFRQGRIRYYHVTRQEILNAELPAVEPAAVEVVPARGDVATLDGQRFRVIWTEADAVARHPGNAGWLRVKLITKGERVFTANVRVAEFVAGMDPAAGATPPPPRFAFPAVEPAPVTRVTANVAGRAAGVVSGRLRAAGHTVLYRSDRVREGVYVTGNAMAQAITVHIDIHDDDRRTSITDDIEGTLRSLGYAVRRSTAVDSASLNIPLTPGPAVEPADVVAPLPRRESRGHQIGDAARAIRRNPAPVIEDKGMRELVAACTAARVEWAAANVPALPVNRPVPCQLCAEIHAEPLVNAAHVERAVVDVPALPVEPTERLENTDHVMRIVSHPRSYRMACKCGYWGPKGRVSIDAAANDFTEHVGNPGFQFTD